MESSEIEKTEQTKFKTSITAVEESKVVAAVDKVRKKRSRRDSKILIRAILESPLRKGEVYEVDGSTPIEIISKQNTDVQTRMFLKIAGQAVQGDTKAAELLLKYGGYTPPVEQNITMKLPVIVDDLDDVEDEEDDE